LEADNSPLRHRIEIEKFEPCRESNAFPVVFLNVWCQNICCEILIWRGGLVDTERKKFTPLIFVLMFGTLVIMLAALWTGLKHVLAQNGGDIAQTIVSEIGTILIVLLFIIAIIFTLRKKRWGFWMFAVLSVLMFVGLALPGMGSSMRLLGPAGFLGISAAILIYQQRNLLS